MEQSRELDGYRHVVRFVVRPGRAGAGPVVAMVVAIVSGLRFCPDHRSLLMSRYTLPGTNSVHIHHISHPLDAIPEQKLFHPELGRMSLTPAVKIALFIL